MREIVMYSKENCPYCVAARNLLKQLQLPFNEIKFDEGSPELLALKEKTGWPTVPIIFIGSQLIGGFTDMKKLHSAGQLMDLVQKADF